MVWRRMGLLDDAIRDHLELKRLRGADPGEVAREEREALETGLDAEQAALNDALATTVADLDAEADVETMPVRATASATATSGEERDTAHEPASSADLAVAAEETAELDMRAVMDDGAAGPAAEGSPSGAAGAASAGADAQIEDFNEDQLEWEVPGEAPGELSADVEHQGRDPGDDGS